MPLLKSCAKSCSKSRAKSHAKSCPKSCAKSLAKSRTKSWCVLSNFLTSLVNCEKSTNTMNLLTCKTLLVLAVNKEINF